MKLPLLRTENLVVQNAGDEVLIYDLIIDKAYALNETSTIIYQACAGHMTFDELKNKYKFTDDLMLLALSMVCKRKS